MSIHHILSILFLFASSNALTQKKGCRFKVDVTSEYSPIISNKNGTIYPKSDNKTKKWYIEMKQGSHFRADCAGEDNHLGLIDRSVADVECCLNDVIKTSEGYGTFNELQCNRALAETVVRTGTCYNGYTKVEIIFMGAARPSIVTRNGKRCTPKRTSYTLITICHDEETDATLWAKSYIHGQELGIPVQFQRSSFKEASFYKEISVGSAELGGHYINSKPVSYLIKGHLMPIVDAVYSYEKRATFYFINAHPQWASINSGNWEQMELKVRLYAQSLATTLTIYTGTYGVTILDDVNGKPVEIWLGRNRDGRLVKRLPCPRLSWKVIHDEERGTGVAIIMINNIWTTVQPKDILCDDICSKLSWVTWKVRDMRLGYTYCCDVASFRKALPFAPDLRFTSPGLLKILTDENQYYF